MNLYTSTESGREDRKRDRDNSNGEREKKRKGEKLMIGPLHTEPSVVLPIM